MQIRRAEPEDAVMLAELVETAFAPMRAAGLSLPNGHETIEEDIASHLVWVAESGHKLFGAVVASDAMTTLHVMNLAVAPEAQGRGLGQLLLETAETWASKAFISQLRLTTHVDMTDAQSFYAKLGWSEAGRDGDKLYMAKEIAVADDDEDDDEDDEDFA